MEIFRRTGYGALLSVYQTFGVPFGLLGSTTLNEKLSIQATAVLGVNETPRVRYLALGIGGHRGRVGSDAVTLIDPVQNDAVNASPYRIMPWAIRELANDFTIGERDKYALRRAENINGVDYAVYYLKRLDVTNLAPKLVQKEIVNNTTTTVDFVPNSEHLNPVPPALPNNGAQTVDGKFIQAVAQLEIVLSPEEVEEVLNAAVILYGSEDYALISELELVSGVDRSVTQSGATYTEAIAAQVHTHINVLLPMKSQRGGFTITLDVGATEPLFRLSAP